LSDVVKSSAVQGKKSQEISAEEKSNDDGATTKEDTTIQRADESAEDPEDFKAME
jgi:hypothetical protein